MTSLIAIKSKSEKEGLNLFATMGMIMIEIVARVMVLGGVFVNRHMSFSGFVIMAIINTLGAVLGHTGVVYNLPVALRRMVTLMNTPYFVFDSGDIKYDSVILLLSVVCPIILVYIGSRFHKFLYFLRSKRPKNKAKKTDKTNVNL